MARDPCLLSTQPTAIAPARPTIAHVQLRDLLVCPRESGVVNYVVDRAIAEQDVYSPRTPTRILARLGFTPNSLTSLPVGVDDTLLAAGGQDKEIHLSYYTPSSSSSSPNSTSTNTPSASSSRPPHTGTRPRTRSRLVWEFEDRLSGSINNSILLTTTSLTLTPAHQSSVEPRVAISNNDGSIRMYDVPLRVQSSRRKLALVGEVRLDVPINHSSISPDGRTLLSVGDSSKVYLHQITGGSRISFSPIHTLLIPPPSPSSHSPSSFSFGYGYGNGSPNSSNSLAASFSTAFSGDGSKFAVASQEGVVAVWDVRWTGRPMRVWYTDKSRGGVGGGIAGGGGGDGGGMYSAGNGVGGHINGGASGWLSYSSSYSHPSPALSSSSSVSSSASPGYSNGNTTTYLSDDPWEWTRGTKAPGWCVRSVKFNAGEGARMGREVMAFTEHTSLIHIVDARTFETHDVIRVPTLFNASSSSGYRAGGKRRSNKGISRDGELNASRDRRRRRVEVLIPGGGAGEGEGDRERAGLPVSHARDTSGGGGTSTTTTGTSASSLRRDDRSTSTSLPVASSSSSSHRNVNANASANQSRPRSRPGSSSRAATLRHRQQRDGISSNSTSGSTITSTSSRGSPYPHPHHHQPGIVQALGDAFRIALPSSSPSFSFPNLTGSTSGNTGNANANANASASRSRSGTHSPGTPGQTQTTPRYSPPASIGDSTWRTLGGGVGVGGRNASASGPSEGGRGTESAGFRHVFGLGSAPPPGRWAGGGGWGNGAQTPAPAPATVTSSTPPPMPMPMPVAGMNDSERRRRGNVRLSARGNGNGMDESGSGSGSGSGMSRTRVEDTVSQNLREWARLAIEEIGRGRRRGVDGEQIDQDQEQEQDYHRRDRDDARRRVRMRMMREEEEEKEEEEEEGSASEQREEEDGIVVVPDLGDRDVESEVHAVLAVHGIPSRLGRIHHGHGHGRNEYEVDEQDEEEDEEDGMDIDVQELGDAEDEEVGLRRYAVREGHEEEEEEGDDQYHAYILQDDNDDEDEDMYDEDYDDDEDENGYDDGDDDDIDLFDVECLSEPGSRTASPGPGTSQRGIRQGTAAEDAALGGYDTFVGGRNAMRVGGGAPTTSMRYGQGTRLSTSPMSAGALLATHNHRHQASHDRARHAQTSGGKSRISTGTTEDSGTTRTGGSAHAYGGRRFGYHDDLDLAGLCFDPCGERMYVLGVLPSSFGAGGGGGGGGGGASGDMGWGMGMGMNMGMGDGVGEGGGGVAAGAVVEWSVRGAEKRWWVDESWM